jgi:hypothetical protein
VSADPAVPGGVAWLPAGAAADLIDAAAPTTVRLETAGG